MAKVNRILAITAVVLGFAAGIMHAQKPKQFAGSLSMNCCDPLCIPGSPGCLK